MACLCGLNGMIGVFVMFAVSENECLECFSAPKDKPKDTTLFFFLVTEPTAERLRLLLSVKGLSQLGWSKLQGGSSQKVNRCELLAQKFNFYF